MASVSALMPIVLGEAAHLIDMNETHGKLDSRRVVASNDLAS